MSLASLAINDLVRIAAASGGFELPMQGRTVNDIVRIAAAASTHKAQVTFVLAAGISVNDLVRIAAAGKGAVVFRS